MQSLTACIMTVLYTVECLLGCWKLTDKFINTKKIFFELVKKMTGASKQWTQPVCMLVYLYAATAAYKRIGNMFSNTVPGF